MNTPIGVFDSGSGGLSVVESIHAHLPNESILYLGDHAHSPYGNKPQEFIRERAVEIIAYLLSQKAKMIVVACNTATVAGIDYYREKFPTVPIIGVVPVIKTASTISKTKQFVVLSTEFTANSEYQKNLIKQWASDCHVENLGSTKLVPLIEDGKTHTEEVIAELHRLLDPLKDTAYDVVALGCTHYPFLRRALSEVVKSGVQILDSGDAIARQVQRILEQNNIANVDSGTLTYQTTGDQQKVSKVFKLLLEKDIVVTHVTV